jgi:hypothetical protein
MPQTLEAIIHKDGTVQLLEKVRLPASQRAIVTILRDAPHSRTQRPYALSAGKFVVPDTFDDPLPDEILTAFTTA